MKEKGGEVPSEASEELPNSDRSRSIEASIGKSCRGKKAPTNVDAMGGLPYSFAVLVFILGIIIGVFL